MGAYLLAGIAFTVGFGLLVIWVFQGIAIDAGSRHTTRVGEIAGGIIFLIFGVLLFTGRLGGSPARKAPRPPSPWTTLFNQRVTVGTAALAGPATHIPGIFYLVALNLIVTEQPRLQRNVVSLLLYNTVWFSVPNAALAICIIDPAAGAKVVKTADRWAHQHARAILATISLAVGTVLLVRGLWLV